MAGEAKNPAISAAEWLRARLRPPWSLRFCDAMFVPLRLAMECLPRPSKIGRTPSGPCPLTRLLRGVLRRRVVDIAFEKVLRRVLRRTGFEREEWF